MMTGVDSLRARISFKQVMPSTNGIMISSSTKSKLALESWARAAEPSVASVQEKPSCSRYSRMSWRMRGSSSTIRIWIIRFTSF